MNLSQNIRLNLKNNLPFCAYKKPAETQVNLFTQQNDSTHFLTDFSKTGFVFAPFNDVSEAVFFPKNESLLSKFDIPNNKGFSNKPVFEQPNNSNKEEHLNLLEKTIRYLKEDKAKKIVISRKECLSKKDVNPINTFFNLLQAYPNAMVYFWFHPKIGLWIGATPEVLLTLKNNRFNTMALAGTQKNIDPVIWENKEKEEQQFVTDYVTKILENNHISYQKSDPYTVKTGGIAHIRTDINGVLNPNFKIEQLIQQLHPTPAVCGLPTNIAKDFILKNENYNRSFYTGFLGELNFKDFKNRNKRNIENQSYHNQIKQTNLYVNLRCMEFLNNTVCLYVGGGITKDSIAKNEFQETVEKAKNLKKFIV